MRIHAGLVWAASVALCVWGGLAWCVPLGPELPQPGIPTPLDAPRPSPETPLDRELFGRDPGQIKAIPPVPRQSRPEVAPGKRSANTPVEFPPKAPLPVPPGLLPDSAEPASLAPSAPAAAPPNGTRDYSAVSETDNPLVDIARRMREAERLLAGAQSGQKTQELQDSILRDLDELLKQISARCRAAQACQGQCASPQVAERKGGNPPPPNGPKALTEMPKQRSEKGLRPVGRTSERPTYGRNPKANATERKDLVRGAWGSLPERDRQHMLQLLPPEQFLPKYESLIEEYYRRLGEDNDHAHP